MLKQRLALPKTQGSRRDLQQLSDVAAAFSIEHGRGGGVIAGIEPEYLHCRSSSGEAGFFGVLLREFGAHEAVPECR
jgi:hypothetical protein